MVILLKSLKTKS